MAERFNSGATLVAGVAGRPVRHSLSPLIHSAWIAAAGLDAAYVPFPVAEDSFVKFVEGMRGGAVRGVNVTIPFKQDALAAADEADALSRGAGAANLVLFHSDGRVEARNTDGPGMIAALGEAPGLDLAAGPAVVLGAGGAARGALAALIAAGAPQLRLVNRTWGTAAALAEAFPRTDAYAWDDMAKAFDGATVVINATSCGLKGQNDLVGLPLSALSPGAAVMDMVYSPLETGLLREARAAGFAAIDGLSMLIRQAKPSFEAFYGMAPPAGVDVRALALAALEGRGVILLGLTGSIGMGKSTTARLFAEEGVPVHDADAAVHRLYAPGGAAVGPVEAAFPGVVHDGGVHRERLSAHVTGKPEALARLEAIVHPLVLADRDDFFRQAAAAPVVVLDIPLLFETGGENLVDAVVVVSAPEPVQRERVLARPGMTQDRLAAILARQVPDAEKRAKADFVIDTGSGLEVARDAVRRILAAVTAPGWRGRRGPAA